MVKVLAVVFKNAQEKKRRSTCSLLALKHRPELRNNFVGFCPMQMNRTVQKRTETVQKAGITCVQTWPSKWHLQAIFFRESFDETNAA